MNKWTLILIIFFLGLIIAALVLPFPEYSNPNIEIRAALDIGSGSTNLKVAKVDTKTDKIVSYLFDKSIPVPYQKHLEQSTNNTFDEEVMKQGISVIKELKDLANQYGAKKVVAVATAAFRKADNARQFAREIEKETQVPIMIIDQDEEGILAFRAAIALSNVQPSEVVVWDIGGGSMQLTALTPEGSYFIDKGKLASIPFKNAVIEQVKKENIQEVSSPNPLNFDQMIQSFWIAEKASQETNPYIKEKILDPNTHVIAVGSLFNYSIRPVVNDQSNVTSGELESALKDYANKSDSELTALSIPEVAVTNPLLVLGYMRGLSIHEVDIMKVNNADGALTYPVYWE